MPLLRAFELPFAYEEAGERKEALVKVKLCPKCQAKLTWKPGKDDADSDEDDAGGRAAESDREERRRGSKDVRDRRRSGGETERDDRHASREKDDQSRRRPTSRRHSYSPAERNRRKD